MADKKISGLDPLTTPATADLFEIVDVSDTTDAGTGTNKQITVATLDTRWDDTADISALRVEAAAVYHTILQTSGRFTTGISSPGAAVLLMAPSLSDLVDAGGTTGGSTVALNSVAASSVRLLRLLNAGLNPWTGLALKLRVRANIRAVTVLTGFTATFGLYPLSSGSPFDAGTLISGSTAAVAGAAANSVTATTGVDFAAPSDGTYIPGVTFSGAPPAIFTCEVFVEAHAV